MKTLFLLLPLFLQLVMPARSSELTAEDLANHFQIYAWTSMLTLPPGTYSLSLLEIVDGKVSEPPIVTIPEGSNADAEDPADTSDRVKCVIIFSRISLSERMLMTKNMDHTLKYSLFVGRQGCFGTVHEIPLSRRISLSDGITEGDFILAGEASGQPSHDPKPNEFQRGVLLRIKKNRPQ